MAPECTKSHPEFEKFLGGIPPDPTILHIPAAHVVRDYRVKKVQGHNLTPTFISEYTFGFVLHK